MTCEVEGETPWTRLGAAMNRTISGLTTRIASVRLGLLPGTPDVGSQALIEDED